MLDRSRLYMVVNHSGSPCCVHTRTASYVVSGVGRDGIPVQQPFTIDEIAEMNSNSVVFKSGLLRFEPEFESEIYEYLRIHNWKDILTDEQIEDTLISGEMEGLQKILNVKEPMYFERVRGIYEGLRGIRANINYKSEELMRGRIAEVSKGIYNTKIVLKPVSSNEDIINEMAEKIKQLEAMVSKAEEETLATEAVVDEPEVEPKSTQKKPSKKSTPKKK